MDDPTVSSLNDHLGYWLRKVSNAVSGSFAASLAERCFAVAEWVMLRELFDGELPASQVAARLGMTKGGVSKLADRLVARGVIVRRTNPEDGRSVVLALTDSGRALVPGLAALADANDAAFFGPLSEDDRDRLRALLVRLADSHRIGASPVD